MSVARSPVDIATLIAAIKREAMSRGDTEPFHETTDLMLERRWHERARDEGVVAPADITALREWMPFHGVPFLTSAYRTLLRREPDPHGLRSFIMKIADGRLTRWEVAGRLRMSAEGRGQRVHVKGLWLGFALATCYRIPVLGPLFALGAHVLCLPAHLQDHARDERLIAQLLLNAR